MLYALHKDTNKLTHVDSVENGSRCNCICPECKLPVIARQGEINQHHFAHERNLDKPIACTFNLIKSCARKLIEYIILNLIICVPQKENTLISDEKSRQRKLDSVKKRQITHPAFYDVTCCDSLTKKDFLIRFKIEETFDFYSDDIELPPRFLLIDVFEFVQSFGQTTNISDEDVVSLILRDSQYKKAENRPKIKSHIKEVDDKCCQRSAEQGFDYCVTCKREF